MDSAAAQRHRDATVCGLCCTCFPATHSLVHLRATSERVECRIESMKAIWNLMTVSPAAKLNATAIVRPHVDRLVDALCKQVGCGVPLLLPQTLDLTFLFRWSPRFRRRPPTVVVAAWRKCATVCANT